MKRILGIFGITLALTTLQQTARTDGCLVPNLDDWKKRREKSFINEPDQKAMIFYSKGKEQLIISPGYSGDAKSFAWIVPVPSRPKVEILQGAPFHELARLVLPPPPVAARSSSDKAMGAKSAPSVTVIERKTVGDYDVSVLAANDSQALLRWLRENRYYLPDRATKPMQSYIKEGWTFVASKIKVHDSAPGLKTGTLSPLRLTFDAPNPVYPMRLSSANPQDFSLLVYVALPQSETMARDTTLRMLQGPGKNRLSLSQATLSREQASSYPTLSRFSSSGLKIYWLKTQMQPAACDQDYLFAAAGR